MKNWLMRLGLFRVSQQPGDQGRSNVFQCKGWQTPDQARADGSVEVQRQEKANFSVQRWAGGRNSDIRSIQVLNW